MSRRRGSGRVSELLPTMYPTICAGLPSTMALAGTERSTTAPARTQAP
ncbi:hypothetical protein N9A17_01340 [Amylibacter sp.]|nr:hypothetical protein [Amylibacter sp.]